MAPRAVPYSSSHSSRMPCGHPSQSFKINGDDCSSRDQGYMCFTAYCARIDRIVEQGPRASSADAFSSTAYLQSPTELLPGRQPAPLKHQNLFHVVECNGESEPLTRKRSASRLQKRRLLYTTFETTSMIGHPKGGTRHSSFGNPRDRLRPICTQTALVRMLIIAGTSL